MSALPDTTTTDTPTPVLTVVQHEDGVPLDLFTQWLAPARLRVVRAHDGEPVPTDPAAVGDGLVVLGGTMDAYADDVAPWLPATRALLAATAASDVPALGICLGAQLLAVAGGGRVQVPGAAGRESGVVEVAWTPDAARDELVGALAAAGAVAAFPTMHADAVVDLPDGAVLLGSSPRYPHQAFRLGSAWGVQFHPETSLATFERWAHDELAVDPAAVVEAYRSRTDELARTGRAVARAFAGVARRRARRHASTELAGRRARRHASAGPDGPVTVPVTG